jgi:ribosomal protein L7/L12
MSEITLEKIDLVRERTGVSYSEAKDALEASEGNVVDALIYVEKSKKSVMDDFYTTKDEFVDWLKDIINKGNVTRIKIKKDDKILIDIPVNAGIAATTLAGILYAPLLGIGFLTAVFTRVTVEITKSDGSVDVVNKTIKNTLKDVKEKVQDATNNIKEKFTHDKGDSDNDGDNVYSYTVKFDDVKDNENKEDNEDKM